MKHRVTKILSLLLTLVMMLSLVPAAAAGSITDGDIKGLVSKMDRLAWEKDDAGDEEAANELTSASQDLFRAYIKAELKVTPAVEVAYNNAMDVYLKYTATVPVTDVFIDPGSFQTLTVGELVTVKAEVSPDNATNKNVIWSVNGTGVTLYADQACTTPVSSPTSLLTVYAKATKVGGGAVIVNSSQEGITPATFNFEVKAAGYTVTYVANNGSGETKEYTLAAGETHTVQGQLFPAPEGMEFAGWLGDDGRAYLPGATITETRTLTAVWETSQRSSSPEKAPADDGWEYHGGGNTTDRAYRSSFAPMQGGKAQLVLNNGETAELMNIYPGTTVWVNPIPDPGYRVASIVWSFIDGSASFDITETKCFVMPAMEVVIFVTFQPIA